MLMTWKIFIDSIKEANLINYSEPRMLIELFKSAGYNCDKDISESTAKAWINGKRNCKVSRYFTDGKLNNEKGVVNFFRKRPERELKELQKIFREKRDADSPIDLETDDMDIFCYSLLNQFLDLLGFERVDMPVTDEKMDNKINGDEQTLSYQNISTNKNKVKKQESIAPASKEKKSISQNEEQPKRMLDIFTQSFKDFSVQDFIDTNPVESIKTFRIEDIEHFIGRIKYNQRQNLENILDRDTDTYTNISEFTDTLLNYVKYLKQHMKECLEGNQYRYIYVGILKDEFEKEADGYRKQLSTLYQTINVNSLC